MRKIDLGIATVIGFLAILFLWYMQSPKKFIIWLAKSFATATIITWFIRLFRKVEKKIER